MFVFLVLLKNGITRNVLSIEDLSAYKISWSYIDWRKFRIHLSSSKFQLSQYSKDPSKKIIIQIKFVVMSTILHIVQSFVCLSAKVHELYPWNKTLILNFNRPPCSHFSFFTKTAWLKVVYPLKIYENTKLHGPTLTSTCFSCTSELRISAILELLQLRL
jgi:hypothetical protein